VADQSERMRAIVAPRPGGPEALEIQMRPRPVPAEGRGFWSGWKPRASTAPISISAKVTIRPPPRVTDVLGLEIAGEIVRAWTVTRGFTASALA